MDMPMDVDEEQVGDEQQVSADNDWFWQRWEQKIRLTLSRDAVVDISKLHG